MQIICELYEYYWHFEAQLYFFCIVFIDKSDRLALY